MPVLEAPRAAAIGPGAHPEYDMRASCLLAAALTTGLMGGSAVAQTIYPINRAEILEGSRFDFKVEFPNAPAAAEAQAAPPVRENTSPTFPPIPREAGTGQQGIETARTSDNLSQPPA